MRKTGLRTLAFARPAGADLVLEDLLCHACRERLARAAGLPPELEDLPAMPESASWPPPRPFDRVWRKVWNNEAALADRVREEQEAAGPLLDELTGCPKGERRARIEGDGRLHTLVVARVFLRVAQEAMPGEPRQALLAAEFALAVAARLDASRYLAASVTELQVEVRCRLADARRLGNDLAGAEAALAEALPYLEAESIEGGARAAFCASRALLRRDQGATEDALALLERAARLYEALGDHQNAGEVLSELGWLCLEEGDPEAALPSLRHAVSLLDPALRPEPALRAHDRLAQCCADLGLSAGGGW